MTVLQDPAPPPRRFGHSTPSASPSLPIVYVGGRSELSNGDYEPTIFSIDSRSGALVGSHTTWIGQSYFNIPVSATPSGDVLAPVSIAELARYDEELLVEHWVSASMGDVILELTSTQENEAVALFVGEACASGSPICLRKLSPAGDTQWTRAVTDYAVTGFPTRPTVSSDGHIAVAAPTADGNPTILVFDDQGNPLANTVLDADLETIPRGMAYAPNGDLVLVGSVDDDDEPMAWATCVQEDGTAVWEQLYPIGGNTDSVVSGVAISSSGRLYLSGFAQSFAENYDSGVLTHGAHAWLAEVAL